MKPKRRAWSVYRADLSPGSRPGLVRVTPRYLGRVMATDMAAALALAWRKWPGECDPDQVQQGFSVRL